MKNTTSVYTTKTYSQAIRDLFIHLYRKNLSVVVIAILLKLSVPTVYRWTARYEDAGVKGLAARKRGRPVGTGRKLSPEQEEDIRQCLIIGEPLHFGINLSGWTRQAVKELIKQRFLIDVAVRTVGDYLKRWNFTPQRPINKAYQQDPEQVQQWLDEFEVIKIYAAKNGYPIYFADESGINTENLKIKSYAPKGKTPTIKTSGKRLRLNVISAVTSKGVMKFMTYVQSMASKLFISFMKQLINGSKKKIILIVDNLKVHHSKAVTKWVKDNSNKIELFYLPSYSQELNPDEYFNNMMKTEIQSIPKPNTQEELNSNVRRILRRLQNNRAKMKKIFDHKQVEYAKDLINNG
jgi:transposase